MLLLCVCSCPRVVGSSRCLTAGTACRWFPQAAASSEACSRDQFLLSIVQISQTHTRMLFFNSAHDFCYQGTQVLSQRKWAVDVIGARYRCRRLPIWWATYKYKNRHETSKRGTRVDWNQDPMPSVGRKKKMKTPQAKTFNIIHPCLWNFDFSAMHATRLLPRYNIGTFSS